MGGINPMSAIKHVSDTASWVAFHRAVESARPDALIHDPLAAKLAGERGREIAAALPYGDILGWIMTVRTVVIDRLIEEAISAGIDTILNIGAGLDTRPYRLKLPEKLRWVEVDFAHMIEYKTKQLKDEVPVCILERYSLDFSNRLAARALYAKISASSKRVLVLTEGVVLYLSVDQAAELAEDLASVANFEFWIQDYRDGKHSGWRLPRGFRKGLKGAPFKFEVPNTAEFFAKHHWKVEKRILAFEEGERLGRPFPMRFSWKILLKLLPQKKREQMIRSSGYLLLKKNPAL